jgi:hypothetical protein
MAAKPEATTEVLTPPPATPDVATTEAPKPEDATLPETYDPTGGYDPTATTDPFDPTAAGYDPSAMGDPAQVMAMMGPFMAVFLLIGLAVLVFSIFCWWKIFSKAGHSGALSLINLAIFIPFIGWIAPLVLFVWFAFSDWPALRAARGEAPKA